MYLNLHTSQLYRFAGELAPHFGTSTRVYSLSKYQRLQTCRNLQVENLTRAKLYFFR